MAENLSTVTKTLSEREKISAILWLVIGILQCFSFFGIVAGAWNIYCAICRFKQSTAVLNPWPGIVDAYDKWMTNIIISIVVNVVLGGVIGVAAALYDMFMVRDYALKNRDAFEQAGL